MNKNTNGMTDALYRIPHFGGGCPRCGYCEHCGRSNQDHWKPNEIWCKNGTSDITVEMLQTNNTAGTSNKIPSAQATSKPFDYESFNREVDAELYILTEGRSGKRSGGSRFDW